LYRPFFALNIVFATGFQIGFSACNIQLSRTNPRHNAAPGRCKWHAVLLSALQHRRYNRSSKRYSIVTINEL
jgi:hypothetical protein